MRITNRVITGLLAGTLLAGSAGSAFAAQSRAAVLVVVAGKVSGVTATGFSLTPNVASTAGKTPVSTTITVSAVTKETPQKGTTGPLTNGEYAVVVGTRTATGIAARTVLYATTAINAQRIAKRVRAARRHHVAVGTVNLTGTTTTTLAITTKRGKHLSFALTSTTKFRVNKVVSLTLPTFTAGERVAVRYKRDKVTKTLVALSVRVLAPKA